MPALTDADVLRLCALPCPGCDGVTPTPDSCGWPQAADASWTCDNDDTGDGQPCGWQGTTRELVTAALGRLLGHPAERTRAIVARSPRWAVLVKGLSIRAIVDAGPVDMSRWDGATHQAVCTWAEGDGDAEAVPPVLAEYLEAVS